MTVSRRPLVLAALLLLAYAFTYNPATLIQRKWKVSPESVKAQIDAAIELAPAEQAETIRSQRAAIEAMALQATLEFKEGKVIANQNGQTVEGTYTLSADAKSLVVTVNGQEVAFGVKTISESQLVVTDPRMNMDVTYIPAS